MYERHLIGKKGEELATKFLKENGYKILERNFLCRFGEIDIIAIDKKELVFIEVKTRTNENYGLPSEAVTMKKRKHIYKATEYYIYIKKLKSPFVRIDVIEVYLEEDKYKINHIKQA